MQTISKLYTVIILTLSLLQTNGQKNEGKMESFLVNMGDYINYEVLPVHKSIQISIVKTKAVFESILNQYDGMKVTQKDEFHLFNETFFRSFPFYDFQHKSKIYQLSNGYIAVDQSEINKANPYYLCQSIEDHKIILKYLTIYYVEESKKPIIESHLHDHFSIKKFLESAHLQILANKSDDTFKLFVDKDGRCIHVRYTDNVSDSIAAGQLNSEKEYENEKIVYHSLVIYESLKVMRLLGIFTLEYSEIDAENFKNYDKTIFVNPQNFIPIKVINSRSISNIIENKQSELKEKLKNEYLNTMVLKNEKVIAQYSEFIFFQFNGRDDFYSYLKYFENAKRKNVPTFQAFQPLIDEQIKAENKDGFRDSFFWINTEGKKLNQSLQLIDKKINEFFFDDQFLEVYFPLIAAYVGNIIIEKKGGQWVYNQEEDRHLITVKTGKTIDFIPGLYEEMVRQRYTGFCTIEGLVEGIIGGSHLNVVPSR